MNTFGCGVFIAFALVAAVYSLPLDDTTIAADDATTSKSTDDIWVNSVYCGSNGTLTFSPEIIEKFAHCKPTSEHYGTEEGEKHPNCAIFCQGKEAHLLGEDGLPNKDLYDVFTTKAFPEQFQEKAKEHAHACIDEFAGKIDLKDEKCEGAGEFTACVNKIWMTAC